MTEQAAELGVPSEWAVSALEALKRNDAAIRRRVIAWTLAGSVGIGGVIMGMAGLYAQKQMAVATEFKKEAAIALEDARKYREEAAVASEQAKKYREEAATASALATNYRTQIAMLDSKMDELHTKVQQGEERARTLTADLARVGTYASQVHPLSMGDRKELYGYNDQRIAEVANQMLLMKERGIRYRVDGTTEEEGLNSQLFAGLVLARQGYLGNTKDAKSGYEALRKAAWAKAGERKPELGDLVEYEGGYWMLMLKDGRGPFVLGMTPAGVLPLQTDFAKVTRVLRLSELRR